MDSGISRICHPCGISICRPFIASPYRSKVNITNFAPTRSSRKGSDIEEFNCWKRDPEMDYPTILERELTTFRPPAGEIESAKIIQREDGKWILRLGIGWRGGLEFDICLYDKRIIKTYSSIVSAVRHVCETYDYEGRIILFPKKGQSVK